LLIGVAHRKANGATIQESCAFLIEADQASQLRFP